MGYKSFFICVILLLSSQLSFAQVPEKESGGKEDNIEIDTVIINKEAVVIRKQVYIDDTQKIPADYNKFLEVFVAPVYYLNYYDVCEDCKDFLVNQKKASSPSVGYRVGLNLSFSRNRIFLIPGIAYSSLRERYNSSDSAGTHKINNSYNYLDLALGVGYKIGQNKLSCIIAANVIMSKLVNVDGKIIASSDFTSTENLAKNNLKSYIYSLGVSFKFKYNLSQRLQLIFEPLYYGNITSVTSPKTVYAQQRNIIATNLGFALEF